MKIQYHLRERRFYENTHPTVISGALRDLLPCAQFKKREKHPWRSFPFSKVAG